MCPPSCYLLLLSDGSRLLIDDKVIVVTDGVHPFEQKRKKVKMTAGAHSVVVEYFEHEGDEALQVDFEGPGGLQQPLATLLASPAKPSTSAQSQASFAIDPVKATKGREFLTSLGCAACHTLREKGTPLAATKLAKPLSELAANGGCLDGTAAATPRYALSKPQMDSLAAAITASKGSQAVVAAAEQVNRTLVRFNCVACHERDKLGGVISARDKFFLSDMPEMGDEGRIPPSLTGVGAKLRPEWLKHIFAEGAKDRPYMLTRMPKFGVANVGALIQSFESADAALIKPAPTAKIASDDERRVKAAGRRLVGSQGFSCIKCHTFAKQKSSGIQALSLTTMTKRLRHDWFYHYLQSPLAYRPGTRMPTPFPDGQVLLPTVLDGTVPSQTEAIWQYLADGDKAIFPVGLVTGKIELMPFTEAIVYRNFIEGAGTRAIGVGYPEKLNLAFDANNMRLALLWHGGFIDAAKHWTARGSGFEKPLGDNVLKLPEGPSLAVLANSDAAWPAATTTANEAGIHFRGYRLGEKQQPTFMYSWHDLNIEDWPRPVGKEDLFSIQRTLRFSGRQPEGNAMFRAMSAGSIQEQGGGSFRIDNRWTLTVTGDAQPTLRRQQDQTELLIPIKLNGGQATIELNYDW
jgi:mono/diheme cytochrome c family protein